MPAKVMCRAARGYAAVTVLLLVLLACSAAEEAAPGSASDTGEPAATTAEDSTATATSAAGGEAEPSGPQTLVVGFNEDPYTVDEPDADVAFIPRGVFETLVTMSPDYDIEPQLATSWEFVEPNTWRFELREDVVFHDGQPFNADAVKYTFDRTAEAGGGPMRLGPDSTEVVDEFTVEVTPTAQNRRLVEQLVHPNQSIIAPGSLPGEEPVGTGPFQFVSYQPQEELVIERFDDYWGDPAILDEITFRFIPEPNARRLALEAGDIDVMIDVPLDVASTLSDEGFVVDQPAPGLYEAMYAKISGGGPSAVLQDLNVRRAIGFAIDREALVQGVFDGLAVNEQTMVPARLLGEEASRITGYEHDPDRAAALLEESGWELGDGAVRMKDGQPLTVRLVSGFPSAQVHGNVAEFVQAQLAEVGIDTEILTAPDSSSYEELLNSEAGDLYLERGNQNDANPAFLPALLFWNEGLFGNIGYQPLFAPGGFPPEEAEPRIGGGEFDETVVDALATPDEDEVKALTAEAMHLLVDEYAIVIPLAGLIRPHATSPRVHGLDAHPSSIQVTYDDAFVTEE